MRSQSERIAYLDFLRIISASAVVLLHTAAQNWGNVSITSKEWCVFTAITGLCRWSVPVFLMISGTLFLSKDISIHAIFRKYVPRIILAFCFWSAIYTGVEVWKTRDTVGIAEIFFFGHNHMWFLYIIVALYMVIPIIKAIIQNDNTLQYFLLLSFVISIILPEIGAVLKVFSIDAGDIMIRLHDRLHIDLIGGYAFYFVLGYYLNRRNKPHRYVFVMGGIGFISVIALTIWVSWYTHKASEMFLGNRTVSVFLESVFIFELGKSFCCSDRWIKRFSNNPTLQIVSNYTFGIYMVHPLVIRSIDRFGHLDTLTYSPFLSVFLVWLLTLLLSFAVAVFVKHIPVIGKYIS